MNQDITGGVTPLKARKSAGKAGDVGKVATKQNPGSGLSVSDTIDTGKGYKSNLESLTAGMRTQGSLAAALGAKGPGGQPTKRSDKKDDFGKTDDFDKITEGYDYEHDPDKVITKETKIGYWDYDKPRPGYPDGRKPTFEEAFNLNLDNVQKVYGTLEEYKRRRTNPDRKKNPNYVRNKNSGYITELVKGEHRRRPYKITNGEKEFTGDWEVYTPKK